MTLTLTWVMIRSYHIFSPPIESLAMMIRHFPLFPLLLLLSCLIVIALTSIILDSLPKETTSVNGGIYAICGVLLTVSLIGCILSLQKTVEAFVIKSTDELQAEVQRVMTMHEMQLFVINLLGLITLSSVMVALASIIVSDEKNSVSPSSFIFACVILAFSTFTLALLLIFLVIRCIEYSQFSSHESSDIVTSI